MGKFTFGLLLLLGMGMFVSCSDSTEDDGGQFVQTKDAVKGKVEKGPLVRGSTVEMRTLDEYLTPTGNSYTARVENNVGDFNYGMLKVSSPYARLTADGYFFNEVDGSLSDSPIKLDAIVDLSDNTTINVNVLTHLKSQRILHLVTAEGKTFKQANEQSQKELLTQFALQNYALTDVSCFSITAGDDAAGVLIAVSSLVQSDRSEAEIVEFLSELTTDFGEDGRFSEETRKKLRRTCNYLNGRLDRIARNVVERYQELGTEVTVKDLAYYFDWDNDGVAGNEIDVQLTVELDRNELDVPAEGGDYVLTVKSDKPYYLVPSSVESDSDDDYLEEFPSISIPEESFWSSLYAGVVPEKNIELSKEMSGNIIRVHVEPAKFRKGKETSFYVYNARGKVAATVTVRQRGDDRIMMETPDLGKDGQMAVEGMMLYLREATMALRNAEDASVRLRPARPFEPGSHGVEDCWLKFYSAIQHILKIKWADAEALGCYQAYLDTYLSLAYHTLSAYWGGVPYLTEWTGTGQLNPMPKTDEGKLQEKLLGVLSDALEVLDEKPNDCMSNSNSMLFVSKDVARIIMANIYANRKEYKLALPLLEKVINNGYYDVAYSAPSYCDCGSECILNLVNAENQVIPCLDYKDVLLTAAECYYHLGMSAKAEEYVSLICSRKGIVVDMENIPEAIATVRYETHLPNYMAYIRRNGLGTDILGWPAEQYYLLLWPIPESELLYNPALIQNPGY